MKNHRILIFAEIELTSPLHLGSGEADSPFSDQPVFRSVGGDVVLPGSSLAGAFAALLTDETTRFDWLGIAAQGADSQASSMIVDDALPLPAQREALRWPVEIRSLVSLDRETLSALQDHHFNMEVVPVGTTFAFFCRCDVEGLEEKEKFLAAMRDFLSRSGSFGGKSNSGLGLWRCGKWGYQSLDLTRTFDLRSWLMDFHGLEWQGDWEELQNHQVPVEELASPPVNDWRLELHVKIEDGLHLSSGTSGLPVKNMPDLVQAKRMRIAKNGKLDQAGEWIDYGTALKGRFRTAMEMLLRTLLDRHTKLPRQDVLKLVPSDPSKKPGHEKLAGFFGHTGRKGAWKVTEEAWRGAGVCRQDHIRLDEFTQHVMEGAKFDFAPLDRGEMRFAVCCDEHETTPEESRWRKALLYGAALLLAQNVLPWGGHASRGYLGATLSICDEETVRPENFREDITALLKALCAGKKQAATEDAATKEEMEKQNG